MKRQTKALIIISALSMTPLASHAGLWSWLFGSSDESSRRSSHSNLIARAKVAFEKTQVQEGKKCLGSEDPRPPHPIGVIHSSINHKVVAGTWYGRAAIEVTAKYDATYGLPFDLIKTGLRLEKELSITNLVVVASPPVPFTVAVDSRSVSACIQTPSGLRTWATVEGLPGEAMKDLTQLATRDAQHQCHGAWILEQMRPTMRDIVLDMIGDASSKKIQRLMASHIVVVFEGESGANGNTTR